MNVLGAILSFVGIAGLICGCVMAVRKMNKLQDLNFRQKEPAKYKKLKSDITPFIVVGCGIFAFIIGFVCLNFA